MSRTTSLLLLYACLAAAQTPDTAILQGQVLDQTHAAVAGARIAARNSQSGLERTATTDTLGRFAIGGLPVAGSASCGIRKGAAARSITSLSDSTPFTRIRLTFAIPAGRLG